MTAPWNVTLPSSLPVGGEERKIRTDYRVALDCLSALDDPELDAENRVLEVLDCLYVDELPPQHWQEAVDRAVWYLRGGEEETQKQGPRLMSWEQDFPLIAPPINKIIGRDIRGEEELHWWTFLSAYMSMGECFFAQVVRIRDLKARGKKLEKSDREFYSRNREYIDIKQRLTSDEETLLKEWM